MSIQAETSQAWNQDSLESWLQSEGFVKQQDGWLCEEISLALLDKTEIISVVRV